MVETLRVFPDDGRCLPCAEVARRLEVIPQTVANRLSSLRKLGFLDRPTAANYRITDKGAAAVRHADGLEIPASSDEPRRSDPTEEA